jgi:hypothetical protein
LQTPTREQVTIQKEWKCSGGLIDCAYSRDSVFTIVGMSHPLAQLVTFNRFDQQSSKQCLQNDDFAIQQKWIAQSHFFPPSDHSIYRRSDSDDFDNLSECASYRLVAT